MGILQFIATNAAMLLVGCALLFVAGLVLYIVGKVLQHKGERLMDEARYAGPSDVQEWATPVYPPA